MALALVEKHAVQVSGQGVRPMLFSHGFGCDQNMWRLVAPAFAADFKTVVFDHVGAGRSDLSAYDRDRYASLNGYADDVLALCDALDLKDVVFVGHSVSAMIGVLAAARRPGLFSQMIMICPSPRYVDDADYVGGFARADIDELLEFLDANHLGWSSTMAPVIMGNPDRPELAEELSNSFCTTDPDIARQFARVTFLSDSRRDLAAVATPTMIIDCLEDSIAPPVVGRYVQAAIAGSVLTTLDATGHCPHLSAPEATIAAMRAYLDDHGPRAG